MNKLETARVPLKFTDVLIDVVEKLCSSIYCHVIKKDAVNPSLI